MLCVSYAECQYTGKYGKCHYAVLLCLVSLCIVSLCLVSLCLVPLCLVPLCLVPLCLGVIMLCHYAECYCAEYRILRANMLMRLCNPPDGSTSPKYKLLCFITAKIFFAKRRTH